MSWALSTRVFGPGLTPDVLIAHLRAHDVRGVAFPRAPTRPRQWRSELSAAGVRCVGVQAPAQDPEALASAVTACSALDAPLIVDAGALPDPAAHEAAVAALARRLHAPLGEGAVVCVRPGDAGPAVLDETGLEWLLEDLPGLGLWLDPVAVLRREAAGEGLGMDALLNRWVSRCRGTFVAGRGSDGRGGRHPEDSGADWSTLSALLPRGIPWVLDLAPEAAGEELEDAVRFLRTIVAG